MKRQRLALKVSRDSRQTSPRWVPTPASAASGASFWAAFFQGGVVCYARGRAEPRRSMDCYEVITNRCTVHNYAPGPVDQPVLERALLAAVAAPNHRMTEPWRFVRVGPESRRELVGISRRLKEEASGAALGEAAVAKLEAKMLNPGELLVVCRVRQPDPEGEREDYAAVACAVYGLMLALWQEGLGSKWSTGQVTKDPCTYSLLGVDSEAEEITGFIWVGRAEGRTPKPRRRRALADVLREVP